MPYNKCITVLSSNNILSFIILGTPIYFLSIFIAVYSSQQVPIILLHPTYIILGLLAASWLNVLLGICLKTPLSITLSKYAYRCAKYGSLLTVIIIIIAGLEKLSTEYLTYIMIGLVPLIIILIPCNYIMTEIVERMNRVVVLPDIYNMDIYTELIV